MVASMWSFPKLKQMNEQADDNMIASGNRIASMTDGSAYNAAALKQQTAGVRAEQGQRAAAAQGIQRMGFAGTPGGAYAGNATEAEILRNRFDNNLNIENARQAQMNEGARMGMEYGDSVNRFAAGREENQQTGYNNALGNAGDYFARNPNLMNAYYNATTDEEKNSVIESMKDNPEFMGHMQNLWERSGGEGPVTDGFIGSQLNSYDSTTRTERVIKNAFIGLAYDTEQATKLYEAFRDGTLIEEFGLEVYETDGAWQVRRVGEAGSKTEWEDLKAAMPPMSKDGGYVGHENGNPRQYFGDYETALTNNTLIHIDGKYGKVVTKGNYDGDWFNKGTSYLIEFEDGTYGRVTASVNRTTPKLYETFDNVEAAQNAGWDIAQK